MSAYLSKADFLVAQTCPAKLYYRKRRYPSTQAENDYLEFLADGGYMVEAIAKRLHPQGVELPESASPEEDARNTLAALRAALRARRITLFGATLLHAGRLARADILKRDGPRLELIEVKSKSYDSADPECRFIGKKGKIAPAWQANLEDVAFQVHLLQQMFPEAEIAPYLCLPDKARSTSIDRLFAQFKLTPPEPSSHFRRPVVTFVGDADRLRADHFLAMLSVKAEVDMLLSEVAASVTAYAASLSPLSRPPATVGTHCRDCEYRVGPEAAPSGFRECWGPLADATPHILEMYQVGRVSGGRANELISQGKACLYDLSEADLKSKSGEVGATDRRRRIQLTHARRNIEWFSDGLAGCLRGYAFPLHFVDFETSRLAVPYHAGMHPYELVAFQWSCHTLRAPGSLVEHGEWINVLDGFPNFTFAEMLKKWLGERGTVFTWSKHERSVLNEVRTQLQTRAQELPAAGTWLDDLLSGARLVDLCDLALHHYFHPAMAGQASLKAVLPAVWPLVTDLHARPTFARYYQLQEGRPIDPYATLPSLPFGEDEADARAVREGTGAMRAYQEMMYGLSSHDPTRREHWSRLLLQYCELDTAAMVVVWWHWADHCGLLRRP